MHPAVADFLREFKAAVESERPYDILNMYEKGFRTISKEHFAESTWPEREEVKELLDADDSFMVLYNLLYFKHLLVTLPTPENPARSSDYADAWDRYRDFFDFVLARVEAPPGGATLNLPAKWVFNIMDEFVWYYETFHKRRNERARALVAADDGDAASIASEDSEGEQKQLPPKEDYHDVPDEALADVWGTHDVLQYLYEIVDKTQIREKLRGEVKPAAVVAALAAGESSADADTTEGSRGAAPTALDKLSSTMGNSAHIMQSFVDTSGFFALICLTRLHAKLGDYGSAVAAAKDIDLAADALFARVQKCHISLYYYFGFALLMARRYSDAAAVLSRILLFFDRTEHLFSTAASTSRFVQKQADKIMALVAVPLATCPGLNVVDEVVATRTRAKYGEKMQAITDMGEADDEQRVAAATAALEELFDFAAPGFIDGAFRIDQPGDASIVAARQLNMFKREALQRAMGLEKLRSFLRLYTTIDVSKVSTFLGVSTGKVHDMLVELKVKNWQPVQGIRGASFEKSSGDAAATGGEEEASGAEESKADSVGYRSSDPMHFYVEGSMISIRPRDEGTDLGKYFSTSVRELASIRESTEKALLTDKSKASLPSRVTMSASAGAPTQGGAQRRAGFGASAGQGSRGGAGSGFGSAASSWGGRGSGSTWGRK